MDYCELDVKKLEEDVKVKSVSENEKKADKNEEEENKDNVGSYFNII